MIRSFGQNLAEAELQVMINEVDADGNGNVDFSEFFFLMPQKMKDASTEEEPIEAVKAFNRDINGFISTMESRHATTGSGGAADC